MNGFSEGDAVTRYIADRLLGSFVLLDIGCSGGIHTGWRAFGDRLVAYAFDPNVEEVERLRGRETNKSIIYEEAFVGVPDGHPLFDQMQRGDFIRRSPWSRLSVAKSIEYRLEKMRSGSNASLTELNQWPKTALASRTIYIPDYIKEHGISNVDFVKLDIDGADFIVLQTLFETRLHSQILGMLLEVNFYGSEESGHHTFHNTDRLMRKMGFELFDLSVRTYSSSALPWPYTITAPAQTMNGRPFQGDALYVRDLTADAASGTVHDFSWEKLAKLVALFSISGHYDQAAEVLEAFLNRLSGHLDVGLLLDTLASEIQKPLGTDLTRDEYLQAYRADHPMFYPGWSSDTSREVTRGKIKKHSLLKRFNKAVNHLRSR
jgi:FkbM family methyltransferase